MLVWQRQPTRRRQPYSGRAWCYLFRDELNNGVKMRQVEQEEELHAASMVLVGDESRTYVIDRR